ncbi:MAG: hypothetical protein HC853_00530 [Anaerolineae bacterium]|nr:hypothetical protein [Anaerolineae bacterium]
MTTRKYKPKSIVLNHSSQTRVFKTHADWEREQAEDKRTPEQRGIRIGSVVMWRHRSGHIILTDRAAVTAINGNDLTITVKGALAVEHTVPIQEIVDNERFQPLNTTDAKETVAIKE